MILNLKVFKPSEAVNVGLHHKTHYALFIKILEKVKIEGFPLEVYAFMKQMKPSNSSTFTRANKKKLL